MAKDTTKKETIIDKDHMKNINEPKSPTKVYTYIGAGEDSPQVIKFMGQISFMRGRPVKVEDNPSNARLLSKIKECPTFIEGVVEPEEIVNLDIDAKEKADTQRKQDKELTIAIKKAAARK